MNNNRKFKRWSPYIICLIFAIVSTVLYYIHAISASLYSSCILGSLLSAAFFPFINAFIDMLRSNYIVNKYQKQSEYRDYLTSKIKDTEELETDVTEKPDSDNAKKQKAAGTEHEDNAKLSKNNILADNSGIDRDIFALMLKNNDETTEYFSISKSQAKIAYTISIITCVSGIIFLIVAIILLFTTQKVDSAVIPLIGGTITEVISGTVFWVYNKSSKQLNHYYDALHENERFLAAVNLVNKIKEDKRDAVYIEIIRSQLEKTIKVDSQNDSNKSSQKGEESGTK